MTVDYFLARQSGFTLDGFYGSGGVRRYDHWLLANIEPQTDISQVLFFGGPELADWVEWATSNYRPPIAVRSMYKARGDRASHLTEYGRYRLYSYRGTSYLLAVQLNLENDYYGRPETHNVVSCYIQSAGGPLSYVIAYGLNPSKYVKFRSMAEKSFAYKNVAFYTGGGRLKKAWGASTFDNVPIRLFFRPSFRSELEGGWAFLEDGTTYVAWSPTMGNPRNDPEGPQRNDPQKVGRWLMSSHVPDAQGETCVIEVGDAASFGDYEGFKRDVLGRNPRPRWLDGAVSYRSQDGSVLVFGRSAASVDGQPFDPSAHPRARMAGLDGFRLEAAGANVEFDFETGRLTGTLDRVPSAKTWGRPPA